LIRAVRKYGAQMALAKPSELVIENVVRRVLHMVREEYGARLAEHEVQESQKLEKIDLAMSLQFKLKRSASAVLSINQPGAFRMLEDSEDVEETDMSKDDGALRRGVIEEIDTLLEECRDLYLSVAEQAIEHIHANEVIMTYGRARTVEQFLLEAGRKRQFQVIVAEAAPSYSGREMAMNLAKAGIDTTLIGDAAIEAMMGRANKVILGTHAVLADGSLIAAAGTRLMAESAKAHAVPVLVCCGLYKLSPRFASDVELFQELHSPSEIIPFEDLADFQGAELHVENPTWDLVPPDLIALFVTNNGGHPPTYIYRLLAEYYSQKDDDLFAA